MISEATHGKPFEMSHWWLSLECFPHSVEWPYEAVTHQVSAKDISFLICSARFSIVSWSLQKARGKAYLDSPPCIDVTFTNLAMFTPYSTIVISTSTITPVSLICFHTTVMESLKPTFAGTEVTMVSGYKAMISARAVFSDAIVRPAIIVWDAPAST
jgi:hypothetical protein